VGKLATVKPAEAVQLFRDMGLIGAGGAGFPTYFKYLRPTPILAVNCEEGEPGYEANKILLHQCANQFAQVFEALKSIFGFKRIVIGAKDKDKQRLDPLKESHGFDIVYTPSQYGFGEEHWLTKVITGIDLPKSKLPAVAGVIVNNVETLYNMYLALFEHRPVIQKYLNVYGEVPQQRVVLAPVGALALDLIGHVGVDTSRGHNLMVIDGGPLMGDLVDLSVHSIIKKTNGLLVTDKLCYQADQSPLKSLPGQSPPSWEDTLPRAMEKLGLQRYLNWHPRPEDVLDVRAETRRVRLVLNQGGPAAKRSMPVVKAGDRVKVGDLMAKPLDGAISDFSKLSVALHASIDGVVKEISAASIYIESI
jgi:Na+-translocating ferredoxin:NAD+ oxidoreductase RnfC subunit